MATTTAKRTSLKTWTLLIVAILLILVLLALGWLLYQLSVPPALKGEAGQRTKGYLFSVYGFGGDLLRRPSSVGLASNGDIYVADTGKRRVVVFDRDGTFKETFGGEPGQKANQIWEPIDVAVGQDGRAYVLDKGLKKIVIYDVTRAPQKEIVFEPTPLSVTIKGDRLYVTTESGVMVGDLDGRLVTGYVHLGQGPGQFDKPGAVAVSEDGTMYIADSFNYRVQALSKRGRALWQYGTPLPRDNAIQYRGASRKFGLPASIALGDDRRLYVVDGTNSEIVVLASDGSYEERIGEVGHDDGLFYYPDGIDYRAGRLVVADKFNDRVQVFALGGGAASQWMSFLPWALLLLPLALLALLLWRRRPVFVASPSFADRLAVDPAAVDVAASLKRLVLSPALAEELAGHDELALKIEPRDASDEEVAELVDRFGIDVADAIALDLAYRARGRRTLLVDDERLIEPAAELEIPVLTYEELIDAAGREAAGADAAESGGTASDEAPDASGPGEDA